MREWTRDWEKDVADVMGEYDERQVVAAGFVNIPQATPSYSYDVYTEASNRMARKCGVPLRWYGSDMYFAEYYPRVFRMGDEP